FLGPPDDEGGDLGSEDDGEVCVAEFYVRGTSEFDGSVEIKEELVVRGQTELRVARVLNRLEIPTGNLLIGGKHISELISEGNVEDCAQLEICENFNGTIT